MNECMQGLWRLGHGSVRVAPRDACAFLPQQPYLPLGDTLRDQLLFPKSSGGGGGGGEESNSSVLIEALEAVGLRHVLDRCACLHPNALRPQQATSHIGREVT